MGRRMVKVSSVVLNPKSFCALTVTWWFITDWVGIPVTIPVVELRDNPEGRDPEMTEKTMESPVTMGVAEKETALGMT